MSTHITRFVGAQAAKSALVIAVVVLVLSAPAAAQTGGPTVSADGDTTEPGGQATVEITIGDAQTIGLSNVPSSWSVASHQDSGGTFNNQIDSEGVIGWVWLSGNQDSKTVSVTFDVPSEATTQIIDVVAEDSDGNTAETDVTVTIEEQNQPPEASLDVDPTTTEVNQSVTFDGADTDDPDGEITEYRWDFDGDGNIGRTTTNNSVTHAYSEAGTYDAELTVVDDDGATNSDTATVSVESAEQSTGTITGQVLNERGNKIAGATVTLTNLDTGATVASTTTSPEGLYNVRDLQAETEYRVNATFEGETGFARSGSVEPSTTIHVDIIIVGAGTPDSAYFDVKSISTNSPVEAGNQLELTATVENMGDVEATQSVDFDIGSLASDSTSVSLDGGESTTTSVSLPTERGDAGEYTVIISSKNTTTQQDVRVTSDQKSVSVQRPDTVSITPGGTEIINVTVTSESSRKMDLLDEIVAEGPDTPLEIRSAESTATTPLVQNNSISAIYLTPVLEDTLSYTIKASPDASIGTEYTATGTALFSESNADTGTTTIMIEEGITEYTNKNSVVTTPSLLEAISDWRSGDADTSLLLDVINGWRSGEPVS